MKKGRLLLLTLVVLAAAVFVNAQIIPAGDDAWVTDPAQTYDTLSIPAGFFGAGSQAFNGVVYFEGDPASDGGYDTRISRNEPVSLATGSGSTSLTVKELRLKSVAPITISYDDGRAEKYDVYVTPSGTQPSTGSMTISGDASGGNFSSTLNIIPKFNFVRVSGLADRGEGRTVKTLDLGNPMIQKFLQEQARIAGEKIRKGIGTQADQVAVAICQAEPNPTEPVPTNPTPTQSAAASTSCGVKISGNGSWRWRNRFCPFPLWHVAMFARHGVRIWGCGP